MKLSEVVDSYSDLPIGGFLGGVSMDDDRYSDYANPFLSVADLRGEGLEAIAKEVLESDNLNKFGLASVALFKERKGYPYRLGIDEIDKAKEVVVTVQFHADASDVKSLKKVADEYAARRRAELEQQREQLLAELEELGKRLNK